MARADYFERSIHAARHVLGDFNQEAFLEKIDSHRVGIAFDGSIGNVEATAAVDLLIRLTARFYPKLAIVALDNNATPNIERFVALATAINPNIDIASSLVWGELLDVLTNEQWKERRKVVVALDTANDRIGVQASLPQWIVNAWTQGSEIGVSRHDFLGDHACMACLYIPRKPAPHLDEQIAQALGFPPQQLDRVRGMIERNQGLDIPTLTQIAAAKNVPIEKLLPFAGKPIQTLYTRGVCSGEVFKLSNRADVVQAEVPMPFQSALAGILQAASLLRCALEYPSLPTITQIDLMRPFPTSRMFSRPELKAAEHCFCVDVDYQDVYREKYHPAERKFNGHHKES